MARSQKARNSEFRTIQAMWRHKIVIDHYLNGEGTPHECWQMVYPKAEEAGARSRASELFNSQWAIDYIEQQQRALAAVRMITRESLVEDYQKIAQAAITLETPQLAAAKSCMDSIAKMCGLNDPDQIIVQKGEISDDELNAAIAKRLKAIQD
jgi:hypothetical protein